MLEKLLLLVHFQTLCPLLCSYLSYCQPMIVLQVIDPKQIDFLDYNLGYHSLFVQLTFTLTGRGARSVHEVRLNVLLGSLTKLHKQSHQEQRGEAERGYQT